MRTYSKRAEREEYEHHKLFLGAGINAPSLVAYNEKDGTLVTDLIHGRIIFDNIYSTDESVSICLKLITEVEKLHNLGYLHGDLTPTNVMVSDEREVYLIDFEFSSEIETESSVEEEIIDLLRLLVIFMSGCGHMIATYNLMALCRKTGQRGALLLRNDVGYDDIRGAVIADD